MAGSESGLWGLTFVSESQSLNLFAANYGPVDHRSRPLAPAK